MPDSVLAGFKLLAEDRFYEAHEAWEEVWLHAQKPRKLWLQALICLAGAGVHRQKGRPDPMHRLLHLARHRSQEASGYQERGVDSHRIAQATEKLALGSSGSDLFSLSDR